MYTSSGKMGKRMSPKAKKAARTAAASIAGIIVALTAAYGALKDPAVAQEARETEQDVRIENTASDVETLTIEVDDDREFVREAIKQISVDAAKTATAAQATAKDVSRLSAIQQRHIESQHGSP